MSISTLTLAMSVFNKNAVRVIDVNKSHPNFYHLYYRIDGKNRVMLVPKELENDQHIKLQSEVETLVRRSLEGQKKNGHADGLH